MASAVTKEKLKQKILTLIKKSFNNVIEKQNSKNVIVNIDFDKFYLIVKEEDKHIVVELWIHYNACLKFCINKENEELNKDISDTIRLILKITKSFIQDTEYITIDSCFKNVLLKINEYDRYKYISEAVMEEYLVDHYVKSILQLLAIQNIKM